MEFEVNLLPHKPYGIWLETLKKGWIVLLLLILGASIILFLVIHAKVITRKTTQVVTSGQEFLKVTLERERVSRLVNCLYQIQNERIKWSDKLISLSEVTPNQIFLTSIEFESGKARIGARSPSEKKDMLIVQGVVIASAGEDPSDYVQKFMKDLKDNSPFMTDFEGPILVSVSSSQEKGELSSLNFVFHLFRKVRE